MANSVQFPLLFTPSPLSTHADQAEAFMSWVRAYYPGARFSVASIGTSSPEKGAFTPVTCTVTLNPATLTEAERAVLEASDGRGMFGEVRFINTVTKSEHRRMEGWPEDRIADVDRMYGDGDEYERRSIPWAAMMPAGFRVVQPELEPVKAALVTIAKRDAFGGHNVPVRSGDGFVIGNMMVAATWVVDHPHFTGRA